MAEEEDQGDVCRDALSVDPVVLNLGKLAKSVECRFSCGGAVPNLVSVNLHYKKLPGE